MLLDVLPGIVPQFSCWGSMQEHRLRLLLTVRYDYEYSVLFRLFRKYISNLNVMS